MRVHQPSPSMSALTLVRRAAALTAFLLPGALTAQAGPAPKLDFSGLMFGAFSYRTNAGAQNVNKFDLERVYLNFRVPVADRLSIRFTPDISPQVAGTGY